MATTRAAAVAGQAMAADVLVMAVAVVLAMAAAVVLVMAAAVVPVMAVVVVLGSLIVLLMEVVVLLIVVVLVTSSLPSRRMTPYIFPLVVEEVPPQLANLKEVTHELVTI